jgi:hypothetical protein
MWTGDGRSQIALTIRPSGSWKWQYRARLSEYRVWLTVVMGDDEHNENHTREKK